MVRAVISLAIACAAAGVAAGSIPQQDYQMTKWTGDHAFLFEFRGLSTAVLGPGKNDALSAWQPLPFPWTFFGERVEGYYISDNGYITFDKAATTSVPVNTTLPSPTAPTNSIFAFWTDIKLEASRGQWDNRVWTATIGQAPNRVHYIYWLSVVPAADTFDSAGFNFGLALYENQSFEAVFSSGRKRTPVKATIGALAADGQRFVSAGADIDFPGVGYGGEDDVNYLFSIRRDRD